MLQKFAHNTPQDKEEGPIFHLACSCDFSVALCAVAYFSAGVSGEYFAKTKALCVKQKLERFIQQELY